MAADEAALEAEQFKPRELGTVETIRHSTAHLLASAVEALFPGTKFGIGPNIDHGFYYDFDFPEAISEEDLPRIEKKMREIAKKNHKFEQYTLSYEEAKQWAADNDQSYKADLMAGWGEGDVSFYKHADFTDMCAGPHVRYSKKLKHFKLTRIAGAYWRGDEKNTMLTRIYGLAFETKDALADHLVLLEEAAKRDHRRLGKDLQLFMLSPDYGSGLVLWLPNGAFIRKQIEDYWRETHLSHGYDLLFTPHVAPLSLWQTSGHADHYSDGMYAPMDVDGQQYQLKPMNCPFHIGVFKHQTRSYRTLPVRYAELGTVYRYERSGALHGLMRVRGFTQDDAHIFCTPDTLEAELGACMDIAKQMYSTFGFPEYRVELSVRDPANKEKYQGDDDVWELSENTLAKVLDDRGIDYKRIEGEAAFYGPKIDVKVVDAIGRTWQLTTIQLDYSQPERFDLNYIGADNAQHRPIMIHRALLGSLERFFGILIEHYAGDFPVWLAPVQARILPLSEKFVDYAYKVADELKRLGVRTAVDASDDKLGKKIRNAEMDKIAYALILGAREEENGTVGVRKRKEGDQGAVTPAEFAARIAEEVASRGN